MKRVILLTVLVLLISSGYLFSDVPCKINYQGRLIKDNVPVHNPTGVPMTFTVDGIQVYTGDVPVYNGLFRVVLDLESIDWTAGEEKSLEVTVDGELLTPPEPIYAYPYAINTHLLEGKTTAHFLDVSGSTQTKKGGLNIEGNVGIGTTSPSPLAKLDIRDETSKSNVFIGGDGVSESNTAVIYTGGADKLQIGSNNSYDDLVIDRNGNVGIGTINPGAKLHVGGTPGTDGIMFPDGTVQTTAGGGGFGDWLDVTASASGGAPQGPVTTDGFVSAYSAAAQDGGVAGYQGRSSPNTLIIYDKFNTAGYSNRASITMPVPKGCYWKVTGATKVFWLPSGN